MQWIIVWMKTMAPAGKQNGPASAVDFTEAGIRTRLRQQIQAAVQSIQWTYSVFWQFSPQQGLLEWADGFYNGVIKTRKTVQPMELSPEDLSAQRSLQLRELFESLSAGETNPPTKRPCAALSPEDLTESEWFYLMCMSFTFAPGVGLPGRALAKRHHVWLSQASDADSKLFTRAILAKSARIQTVLCIPLVDGVLEMGSTDMIREDVGLVQHVKNMMVDHSKPACSEQSTSNPPSSGNLGRVLSEDQPIVQPPARVVFEEQNAKTKELSESGYENPHIGVQVCGLQSEKTVTEFGQHESEIMELDMSPEDCSNDNDIVSDVALPGANTSMPPKSSLQAWSDVSHGLHSSGPHHSHEEANEEDRAHYSKTVSFVLQQKGQSQWTESSPTLHLGSMSDDHLPQQTAFSPWTLNAQQNKPNPNPQWMLKYILLTVSRLHSKDSRDHENSPRVDARDGDNSACRPRKNGQDDLTVNHVLAERRRREKLNEKFIILRTLVPFVTKMDKASILGDAIEYVKQLRRRIQELEARSKQMEIELKGSRNASPTQLAGRKHFNNKSHEKLTRQASSVGNHNNNQVDPEVVSSCRNSSDIDQSKVASRLIEKRKIRVLEGFEPLKIVEGCNADIQVSIIEREALVELQCPWRDGLLLDVMQTINSLRLEAYSVQSSMLNQTFVAKIRAKVREAPIGLKPTITEVKTAIQSCIPIPS